MVAKPGAVAASPSCTLQSQALKDQAPACGLPAMVADDQILIKICLDWMRVHL